MFGPWIQAGLSVWWPAVLGLLVLFVPTYYKLAGTAWATEEQAHGPVVLLAVLWLVWRDRQRLANIRERPIPLWGTIFLGVGLLLYIVGRSQDVPLFETFSEIPILVGVVLLLRGGKTLGVLWIPIFFLIFIVPIPGPILDAMTSPLKYLVSDIVESLLYFLGYPIARSGVLLTIGHYQLMVADGSLDVLRILSAAAATIAEGEVLQLTTQNDLATTEQKYFDVIRGKTAALFAAACEVGGVIAGQPPAHCAALAQFGMDLGMAFQLVDDALDYSAVQAELGKTVGDDFREGKLTYPVLLALAGADDAERAFWARTVGEGQQGDADLGEALRLMGKHQTTQRSLERAGAFIESACAALGQFPDSPVRQALMDVARYTTARKY
ncbi:MAG: hypothetical protein B7Z81_14800 [Acidocella sp. 20-61-6]|nr:MAG: hypothetical protein B7Z81_14800 [Acidocella sp. 20-61-6]